MGEHTAEFSGGVCEKCFIGYVRSRQLRFGLEDCFKRATEICDKSECTYHKLCCKGLGEDGHENPQDYFEHNSCELC